MLNLKNDIEKMMKYHRTRDMINLLLYFKELSPVKDLTLVESVEEYLENKEYFDSFDTVRTDNPITENCMESYASSGKNPDMEGIIKKIKKINKNSVMVLIKLKCNPSERYERYAGINVLVNLYQNVCIEAVGKGFDAREVTKGISTHERYIIPWSKLKYCNEENFNEFRTYLINQEDYIKSREERINYLETLNLDRKVIEENIPVEYNEIPMFIWKDIIRNLIKKLPRIEEDLEREKLKTFVISGHTEGKYYSPWQMYDKSRKKK